LRVRSTVLAILIASITTLAQSPADPQAKRVSDRIAALQREAEQLAGQSRTLLGELRQLEIDRDLRIEEAHQADDAVAAAQQMVQATSDRVAALEQQREAQLPDLRAQLVDVYKRGHTGYAQLLFGGGDLRDFARAGRAVAALSSINQKRIEEHRATLRALQAERDALQAKARDLRTHQDEAARARLAAQRAVVARTALIAKIDSQRDLTAQYVGELQQAYDRIAQQLPASREHVEVPLAPFRGGLDWPVMGRVTARFGQTNRPGGAAVRNGIEIAAAEGAPVRAVHGGTVAYADAFAGFGTLVIVDHGTNDFTLYGNLGTASVARGDAVDAGSELGRVGDGPGGAPALYFEVRIDGRSVDPIQWLRPR
jgi:septal ring factor EnvC (AmiA/AmiB activator)